MRQIHHWAALIFVAAIIVHMFRVFFTGAFRKPRELNWVIGGILALLAIIEGFAGYSLPDDLLSGTGLRIADGIILAIPVIGSYLAFFLFGGEFPGEAFIPRLYTIHVLLLPAIFLALIAAHLILLVVQKHTQYPGPGRTERQRRRLPALPGVHGQGRRLLLHRLRRHRPACAALFTDQPDLDVRRLRPVAGLRRLTARLVHGLHRRRGPPDAGLLRVHSCSGYTLVVQHPHSRR